MLDPQGRPIALASAVAQEGVTAAVASARLDLPQLGVESPPAGVGTAVLDHLAAVAGPVMVFGDRALVSDAQVVEAARAQG